MKEKYPACSFIGTSRHHGFTLVELMITVAISGFIIAAIYSAYLAQQRSYVTQEQVAQMQQNIRAAMDIMTRELRMTGFDPTGGAITGIETANPGLISFTQDTNSDGDSDDSEENLSYSLYVAADGIQKLGRRDNNDAAPAFQAVAENFDVIEFNYLDATGAVTATLDDIHSVQISILARAGREDRDFTNTMTYTPASGNVAWDINGATAGTGNPPNDNFRRRLLITTIQCRN
jgi:type IV pilus assembly protein PilW